MTGEEVLALVKERAALSKQQETAILVAAYHRMSKEEVEVYEKRHARIVEITRLLASLPPL